MAAKDASYDAIVRSIKAGDWKPVYVLMGAEAYYIDQLQDLILANALPEEERDFCLSTFYGAETTANTVINAARSFPMGTRMVVVLKNAGELKDIDELAYYLQNPQPTTVLVLVNKNGNLDKRKKFLTLASKIGVVYESQKLRDYQLPPVVSDFFRRNGYAIDAKSVMLITESVGADLTRLYGEMKKLIGAMPQGEKTITPSLVEKYIGISKDFNQLEFQNALILKDSLKAFRIAKYFDENPKQNPIFMVLPIMYRLFSQLMMAYYAPAKDKRSLAQYLGSTEWVVEKSILPAMRNYSATKVFYILQAIRDVDEKVKGQGGSNSSNGDLMKQLIFFILH